MNSDDPARTFPYGRVEWALGRVFGAGESTLPALRGRINGLWRHGFTQESPGRGKVIRYQIDHIYDLALALSLAEFGLPPKIIARAIRLGTFRQFAQAMAKRTSNAHLYLIYFANLFYETLDASQDPMTYVTEWEDRLAGNLQLLAKKHVAIIDLTDLKNRIDEAIAEA